MKPVMTELEAALDREKALGRDLLSLLFNDAQGQEYLDGISFFDDDTAPPRLVLEPSATHRTQGLIVRLVALGLLRRLEPAAPGDDVAYQLAG